MRENVAVLMRRLARTEPMNWRLRAYISIIFFRHVTTGAILVFDNARYERSESFLTLFQIADPEVWAVMMFVVAAIALSAILRPSAHRAYLSIHLSVFLSIVWAASFAFSKIAIPSAGMLLASVYASVAAKDLTVSGMPYHPPIVVDPKEDARGAE